MTQTPTEAAPAAGAGQAIGQAVGQAESVLARLLAELLAQTDIKRETYLALQRLEALGDTATTDQYARDLADWLDLDLWSAGELANGLVADGLITAADGMVHISDAGAELRAKIVGLIRAVNTPIWQSLNPSDVEITVRTLLEITMHARAVMASQRSTPQSPRADVTHIGRESS